MVKNLLAAALLLASALAFVGCGPKEDDVKIPTAGPNNPDPSGMSPSKLSAPGGAPAAAPAGPAGGSAEKAKTD